MTGTLVCYDPWSLAANLPFARALASALRARLGRCRIAVLGPGDVPVVEPDDEVAVVRSRDVALRRWLAARLPLVLNGAHLALIGNDKLLQARWLAAHGFATPGAAPAWLERSDAHRRRVAKPRFGHGGSGVAVLASGSRAPYPLDHWIVEPHVETGTRVVRAYVLGTKPSWWVERRATDGIAANRTRGAVVRPWQPDPAANALVTELASALGPGYYGIDLFEGDGGWLVNEIEDVVGARALWDAGIDVAAAVADMLAYSAGR